jgi:hypothetical protein
MSIRDEILNELAIYGIADCAINEFGWLGFAAQDWTEGDTMEPRPTVFYFFFPERKKADQWISRGFEMVTGITCCACQKPRSSWIFLSETGDVYALGKGGIDGDEPKVLAKPRHYFSNVKCIRNGYAYAVGTNRKVFRRDVPGKWTELSTEKLVADGPRDNVGFTDIDGFSESDIYACGGLGDLWRFDGNEWHECDAPSNALFEKICCGTDGKVYVTTNKNQIIVGRDTTWTAVDIDLPEPEVEDIVEVGGKIFIGTDDALLEFDGETATPADIAVPEMLTYAHLSSNGDALLVAGANEANVFANRSWELIYNATQSQ